MEQLHIYDYLGVDTDPIFRKIKQLKKGQSVTLKDIEISLNHYGIYEVSTVENHEGFNNFSTCYKSLTKLDRVLPVDQ